MGTELWVFKKFIDGKKISDGQEILREELITYLVSESKYSLSTIRNSIYFFGTLGFITTKDRKKYVFHKKKFDEFFERNK